MKDSPWEVTIGVWQVQQTGLLLSSFCHTQGPRALCLSFRQHLRWGVFALLVVLTDTRSDGYLSLHLKFRVHQTLRRHTTLHRPPTSAHTSPPSPWNLQNFPTLSSKLYSVPCTSPGPREYPVPSGPFSHARYPCVCLCLHPTPAQARSPVSHTGRQSWVIIVLPAALPGSKEGKQ